MAESWHEEMLRLQRALSGSSAVAATQDTQNQIRQEQLEQTEQLITALDANTAAVGELRGAYSATVRQPITGSLGVLSLPQQAIDSTIYQTFELTSIYAYLTTDAQVGDRFVSLELTVPNMAPWTGYPEANGRRILYRGFQAAAVPALTGRHLLWAPQIVSDNFSRVPTMIQRLSTAPEVDYKWRLRSSFAGPGDLLVATFIFNVFKY